MKDEDFMNERISKKYLKWLPDTILNIFVRATATDPGKYTPITDLYM